MVYYICSVGQALSSGGKAMRKKTLALLLMGLLLVSQSESLYAVVIDAGTGTENTAPPASFPYWDNIAQRGIGTGIYMGNRWVLTASHVGAGSITLGGVSYDAVSGSTIRLVNNDATPVDLILYRINGDPGLQSIPLPTVAPATKDHLMMIGAGYNRQAPVQYWDEAWAASDQASSTYTGYYWDTSGRTLRYGTNTLSRSQTTGGNYGKTATFSAYFSAGRCMAAAGDSGGPVFIQTGANYDSYSLAGVMLAISTIAFQPENTSVIGDYTFMADLYAYRSQLKPLDGDANLDGLVDQADYKIWYDNYGTGSSWRHGDWNSDGIVDQADYKIWYDNYGAHSPFVGAGGTGDSSILVPEPLTALLLICAGPVLLRRRLALGRPGVTCSKASARRGR
jgi:hypothetical protein